jgi:HSP20 family protein
MLPLARNRFVPALSEPSLLGPWSDLRREIDRWFESTLPGTLFSSTWVPAMDVEETEDAVRLSFEVPGVDPEHLSVTVENGTLTIAGEKKFERENRDEKTGSQSHERQYGRFERSVVLPQSVDTDKVSANCTNGVLTIELPKAATARPRTIQITSGEGQARLGSGKAESVAA